LEEDKWFLKRREELASEIVTRPTSTFFGGLFSILKIIFLWGIFILILLIILSAIFTDTPMLKYVYDAITDPLMNSGFGNFVKEAILYATIPFSAKSQAEILEQSTWETYVEKTSDEDFGVKIDSFRLKKSIIPADYSQEIEAVAEGSILTLEGTTVEFSCLAEGVDDKDLEDQNQERYAYPDMEENFFIECVYRRDMFDIDEIKETDSKKVKLKVSYDFLTESNMIIYTMDEEIKSEMKSDKIDIFEGVDNDYLKKGVSYSVCTEGPLILGLRIMSTQPYNEEGPDITKNDDYYSLSIKIDDNQKWNGDLEDIESLELLVTSGVEIVDEGFVEDELENKLNVYGANDEKIREIINLCPMKEGDGIDADCWRRGSMEFDVDFKIKEASEDLTEELIKAKIRYRYGDIKQDTITFIT